ncbi:MAG: DUF973 family protein [Metallosphaera sp.]|uniref:DUF973 family protein n=1 Tax=Metallosphaera sp. TaxID=2020860 RepID=UPI00317924D0
MTQQNLELEGVKNLKSGALFYLITVILYIVSLAFIITLVGILIGVIVGVIDFVTLLLAFLRTRRGFSQLETAGRHVGGKTATTLIIAGYALVFIGSIVALALFISAVGLTFGSAISGSSASAAAGIGLGLGSILGGLAVIIIGALIMYIGYILLASAYKNVGSLYNVGSLRTGGTLMLVGSILYFLSLIPFIGVVFDIIGGLLVFIGIIMVYSGLGTLLSTLQSGRYPGFNQPYYSQPYQGAPLQPQYPQQPFNRIYGNGVAEVNVYSPGPVQVTSATIIGTSYFSEQVTPTNLATGNNVIRISFNGPLNLVPGNVYTIQITLSNGQLITVNATYQP